MQKLSKKSRCRFCQKRCRSNALLENRFFREKFQDVICMWIDIKHDCPDSDVCFQCETDISDFYAYKQQSRDNIRSSATVACSVAAEANGNPGSPEQEADALQSLLDNCDETVEWSIEALEELNSPAAADTNQSEPKKVTKPKKVSKPRDPNKPRKQYKYRTPEQRLAEKLRPKRPIRKKTEEEKAMDPEEYRRYYYKKNCEKYKQTCELCGKRMASEKMDGHMNGHKGLEPYECEQCGLRFNCKWNMKRHVQIRHATGQDVTCNICDKVFNCATVLRRHKAAVHDEKKFTCELCGLKILSQHSLIRHMNIHNQKRDYICPHCGKAFYCKSVLTIHLRTHSGETPYNCTICPKGFIHRRIYVMHMEKLHPNEPMMRLDGTKAMKSTLMQKY